MTIVAGKPYYVKLHRVTPHAKDVNIIAKVMSQRVLVDTTSEDGKRTYRAQYTVADDSGSMTLDVHRDISLKIDDVVALHNVQAKVVQNKLRLYFGKWSTTDVTVKEIRGEVGLHPDLSATEYNKRA